MLTTKRYMNRFYSTLGRVRRVDSLSKLLILRLNSFLATHNYSLIRSKEGTNLASCGGRTSSVSGWGAPASWGQRRTSLNSGFRPAG